MVYFSDSREAMEIKAKDNTDYLKRHCQMYISNSLKIAF